MQRVVSVFVVGLLATSCEQAGRVAGTVLPSRKAIAELPYEGDRPDAPPLEERGNAQFTDAAYDDTGKLLVTQGGAGSARLQVWNAEDGTPIAGFDAIIPNPGSRTIWMIDSGRRRLFARTGKNHGFALFDLMTGETLATIADTDDGAGGKVPPPAAFREPYSVGLVNDNTQAVIFKPGVIELWDVAAATLVKRVESPFTRQRFAPGATGGTPGSAYTDKHQWEWSPDRRTLAVAYTPEEPPQAFTQYMLLDTATLEVERLTHPNAEQRRSHTGFAFSPDGHWLAIGDDEGFWLYDRTTKEWVKHIAGEQHRSNALAPMRFIADSSRLIALGDQLQISVYNVPTGSLAGRHTPDFENWEGALKISASGSRILVYKFVSDTFEVLDGSDANRLGWVCPYFCNVKHAPLDRPFAVSPDGKSVAISNRRGVAVWNTETDTIRFPLRDAKRKPLS
jgi:hypothetical protein